MDLAMLLEDLRSSAFYRGQILRTHMREGAPASSIALGAMLDRMPRLKSGSAERVLRVLGMEEVYANLMAGLGQAFPFGQYRTFDDAILVAGRSKYRELLWQVVCLLEALDEGRLSIILCSNTSRLQSAAEVLQSTIDKAGISYALSIASIEEDNDFAKFDGAMPMIVLVHPQTLRVLLRGTQNPRTKERILSSLGRVIVPSLDEWLPALATNTAYLLRELHLECVARGVLPTMAGTSCPAAGLEAFVSEFWGKPVEADAFVKDDSVECPPRCFINYSGAMARDPSDRKRWMREPPPKVASDLLDWLVRKDALGKFTGTELHYVLDVSGSMCDSLEAVGDALINDFRAKLDVGSIKLGDRVKLTTFDSSTRRAFPAEDDEIIDEGTSDEFASVVKSLTAEGGTDIAVALGTALESAIQGNCRVIDIILFSDGESPITERHRRNLLKLMRQACSQGRSVGLLYVVLDDLDPPMDPPADIRNLIEELGGKIVVKSLINLDSPAVFSTDNPHEETVLFISGEKGLSEEIVQQHQTGTRRLVFTRDTAKLCSGAGIHGVNPKSVVAAVVSGRFASLAQIEDQVQHLGRNALPVFVLSEAEAWGQMMSEQSSETEDLRTAPLIWTSNPVAQRSYLRGFIRDGRIDIDIFRYITEGPSAYQSMLGRFGVDNLQKSTASLKRDGHSDVLSGFEVFEESDWRYVHLSAASPWSPQEVVPSLQTFSTDTLRFEGSGIAGVCDRANAGLLLHPGAIVDQGAHSAQVHDVRNDIIVLDRRTFDRVVPLLDKVIVKPLSDPQWTATLREVDRLGQLSFGKVHLSGNVIGRRTYPRGNLDDRYEDVVNAETGFDFETFAMRWVPSTMGATANSNEVVIGLANILRLTGVLLFRYADQTVFVYPDGSGAIWVIDLAIGGNGASRLIFRDHSLLVHLLSVGGRMLLNCPCEGGFASVSTASAADMHDTGCPRCARVAGMVVVQDKSNRSDLYGKASKRKTLDWLLFHRYLPSTGEQRLVDKYEGVEDLERIMGRDDITSPPYVNLIRRIIRDRLGIEINDNCVAAFQWKSLPDNTVGLYDSGANQISLVKGLREWLLLSVLAHEMYHNYQFRGDDLFNHEVLGESTPARHPFEGKLYIEGSAMWAESHVVDALSIRSSLTAANLRHGDEYAEGFQLFKYIEESYGCAAVLNFLRTGDISQATHGKIGTLNQLLAVGGIRV